MNVTVYSKLKIFAGKQFIGYFFSVVLMNKPEDHWSCIAYLTAEDILKSAVIEEKKFKNIECK